MGDGSPLVFLIAVVIVGILVLLAISMTKKKGHVFDKENYQIDLMRIEKSLQQGNEATYAMAIIEGDKLLESKKEIDKVNDYAKENNISYSEASEQLGFGKTVSFDEFTQEMIEKEEQKDDEESKEFVNWLKETSTNKTYNPALLAINEQFANKNREYEKQFYDEFFEKYKDDELLKKFL